MYTSKELRKWGILWNIYDLSIISLVLYVDVMKTQYCPFWDDLNETSISLETRLPYRWGLDCVDWPPQQKSKTSPRYKNDYPGYDTKQSHGEASVIEIWGEWSTFSLPLLPCPLWPGVFIRVRAICMGQKYLFENHSYSIWLCEKKEKKTKQNIKTKTKQNKTTPQDMFI